MKPRPLDLDALLGDWPGPRPTAGFADRVLAACIAPPAVEPRRPLRARSLLAAAALAAALILVPLFVSRGAPSLDDAPAVAVADPDLGPRRD